MTVTLKGISKTQLLQTAGKLLLYYLA